MKGLDVAWLWLEVLKEALWNEVVNIEAIPIAENKLDKFPRGVKAAAT